ncbi:MAG: filamentous hemagglutinin outer membrane protein [Pseudomonas sp.]|nr:filamentous hemagglutinin outer membrane protein [Pseudomonas sp.]
MGTDYLINQQEERTPVKTSTPHPRLRPDALRWAMFVSLLAPPAAFANGGLNPAAGPGGTPLINNGHGVPVIDIVAPNANGLSHNQFLDYNVGRSGVVLNNATGPGQSQLAGALNANPQFQGQAASTILNEVISRNASLIEGPQEIFGRPADYVLANPNGITLNGGSFINTTRAGFLVGTPDLQGQTLRHLDTLEAAGSLLVLKGGQSNADGALELIAPRIESLGPLEARDDLTLTAGRNRIDAASGEVLHHLPGTQGSLDASLFGAMRAGRIRINSTAEGAGVRVGRTTLQARDGIAIGSAGSLHISGSEKGRAELLSERGELSLKARDELALHATLGQAERIDVQAGKDLRLDTQMRETIKHDNESWDSKAVFITYETYDRTGTRTDRQQLISELHANGDISLRSGDDTHIKGAKVDAGGTLTLNSGGNMSILAALDSTRTGEQVRHRKHLWRGDSDSSSYEERAVASHLGGERVDLKAGSDLTLAGSSVESRADMTVEAANIEAGTVSLKREGSRRNYRGDLVSGTFFGDRSGNDSQGDQAHGSRIHAAGTLDVTAGQVRIRGSDVHSDGDGVLYSSNGLLSVESAQGTSSSQRRESDSRLFNLIGSTREHSSNERQVLVSDVSSSTNLRLASADEMQIRGAKISAGQDLQLQAEKDIGIASAESTLTSKTSAQNRGFSAHAGQTQDAQDGKPESRQYNASIGYKVDQTSTQRDELAQTSSELSGARVSISTHSKLEVNGSQVNAHGGDLDIKAETVALGATRNEQQSQVVTTDSGGGLAVSGGIDRIGSAFEGHHQRKQVREKDSTAQRSELRSSGDLKITAREVVNDAASIKAGRELLVGAERIDNRAVQNIHEREESVGHWKGNLGASVEYRGLTRPIENLLLGQEAPRFQQPGVEDALVAPSVGADLGVAHVQRKAIDSRSTAQVNALEGTAIVVKAQTINDEGTSYQANVGSLKVDADNHNLLAARDSKSSSVQRLDYEGDVRVDTNTGTDLSVRLAGKGGSLDTRKADETARPGSLYGQTGIQVQLGSDGLYEGSRINGGEGSVLITAKGDLKLTQADDSQRQQERKLDGSGWAKGGNSPAGTGIEARGYLDHGTQQSLGTQARVAQIDAKGEAKLSSGGDMLLEGTRIGERTARIGDINLDSGGLLQVKAASNTHTAEGSKLGGGLEIGAKHGGANSGSLGGHIDTGRIDEQKATASNASFNASGNITLASQARDDQAVHLQGLQASASTISLNASNGGILVESSSNTERRDNLDVAAGAGFNMTRAETAKDSTQGLHGRVQVALDRRNDLTHNDSLLRADKVAFYSLGDARMEGARVEASRIEGQIGGDLAVASRKDSVDSLTLKVDGRLSKETNPQGYTNAAKALAGPAGAKVGEKAGPALSKVEPGLSPTFSLDLSHRQNDSVARQSLLKGHEGIDLQVGGDTRLIGARLQSGAGSVELGGSVVSQQTLSGRDYRRDVAIDASNAPVDLGTAVINGIKHSGASSGENPLDLGLLKTSGHDRREQWDAGILHKGGNRP